MSIRSRAAFAGLLCSLTLSAPALGAEVETSLADVLRSAEANAPRRVLVDAQRRIGDAARAGAAPWLPENPTLELGVGPRVTGGSDDRGLDLVASIQQPVAFGLRSRRRSAAERTVQRLASEASAEGWQLRREVTLAYREGQLARLRLAAALELAATGDELLRIAERRRAGGEATAIDARIAAGEATSARQGVSHAREDLRLAQLRLCELAGFPPEAPPLPVAVLDPIEPPAPLDELLARAAAANPTAGVSRALIDEAHAEVAVVDREGWPRPGIGVSYAHEGASGGSPATTIILGTISLPLPLAQRNPGERARARAVEGIARAESTLAARGVAFRVRRAHVALTSAAERVVLYADATASLAEGLALLKRGFEVGQLPLLDVAVARDRLVQSQAAGIAAREEYERARVELEDAVGIPLAAISRGGQP